jgi:hypothetical protein
MDDVIAVAVTLDNGERRFFMTWGRVQDTVDPGLVAEIVLRNASSYDLGGTPERADVCWSLQDASHEVYFYEGLLAFASERVPRGRREHRRWRARKATAMESADGLHALAQPRAGVLLRYLGRPRRLDTDR